MGAACGVWAGEPAETPLGRRRRWCLAVRLVPRRKGAGRLPTAHAGARPAPPFVLRSLALAAMTIYRSPLPDVALPNATLPAFVMQAFASRGARPALIDGPSGRTLTYAGLDADSRALAAGLAARGFGPGDVFGIYSPNLPEYATAFYGVWRAGGTVTTLNPLYTADEAAGQLQDAGARFLVTVAPFLDKARAAAEAAGVEEVFVFGEADGATPFAALFAPDGAAPALDLDPAEAIAALPYSSGTTGLPKGVMLTHRNIAANIAQCAPVSGIREGEVTVGILPFYHIYGLTAILSLALYQGATIVTMPRFELEAFLELVQQHGIESGFLVPPILLGLAKHPAVDDYDLRSLRLLTSGAAPLGEDLARAVEERLGVRVRQGYGMTEASPVTHLGVAGTAAEGLPAKPATAGPAVPNTEVRIVDVAGGGDLPVGEAGEVWVRGPQVMKGYLHNPEATAATVDADGWLHTGDVGRVDADGYLTVTDRLKALIKYKGFQVAPAELEALLLTHDDVADAAVIGRPDAEAGEVPMAFVVRAPHAPSLTAEAVQAFVAARVAPHKKVRHVAFLDAIPKTASGKILRRDLAARAPATS